MSVRVINADCMTALPELAAEGVRVHAVVCDPPYGLGFMGKAWDSPDNVAFRPETWAAVMECMLPGAHLVAFGGTRTYHRMAVAIEDAGFEIRDSLAWLYGSGFPKSHDVSKGIDKAAGAERVRILVPTKDKNLPSQAGAIALGATGFRDVSAPVTPEAAAWAGWGTALKPAIEPIILARKPLIGTVAANVLAHGTGALNIDGCLVGTAGGGQNGHTVGSAGYRHGAIPKTEGDVGRWPANVIHDGSDEVLAAFAEYGESTSKAAARGGSNPNPMDWGNPRADGHIVKGHTDTGSASRFFFCGKADASDRVGSKHPTVKPGALMRWLVQLVTPPGGTVLDPFAGTGSTGLAADQLGMNAILIEQDETYAADIARKIAADAGMFTSLHTEDIRDVRTRSLFEDAAE